MIQYFVILILYFCVFINKLLYSDGDKWFGEGVGRRKRGRGGVTLGYRELGVAV